MTDNTFLTAKDMAPIIHRSENFCYKLIRELNKELEKQGYLTVRARIPASYFYDRVIPASKAGDRTA